MEFTPSKPELPETERHSISSTLHFYSLLESIPDAVMVHDINGNVLAMNDAAVVLAKLPRREVRNYNIFDLARGRMGFGEVSDQWPDVLSGRKIDCQWRFHDRELNQKVELSITMSPTIWTGKPAIVSVIRDSGYRHHFQEDMTLAQKALMESESRFRALFEQSMDGIFVSDRHGNFTEVNESGCNMLAYTAKELATKNIRDIIWKENLRENPVHLGEMRAGKVVKTERVLVRKDGSTFPAEVCGIMFTDGKMQAIVRDISERKNLENDLFAAREKAEESERLQAAFLHNMSHEIRTPLNVIMGFSDLLPEYSGEPERLRHFIEIIRQRGDDLISLIDDILDLSRIQSGQVTLNPEPCDLGNFLESLKTEWTTHQIRSNKVHIHFDFRISQRLYQCFGEIDQFRIRQILANLVDNAFKFTSRGKVVVNCRLEKTNVLSVTVSDTGIGIAKEKHNSIFSRFYQAEHHSSRVFGGTGLGLSIVSGLVQIMGGNIWLDSEPGKGSNFYFTVPFKKPNHFHKPSISPAEPAD
jgi:PAS domain S-box-containing protein